MKSKILSLLVLSGMILSAHAQKIYATRTGQVFFNASGGMEKIAAVNNQVESKMLDKTGQIVFSLLVKGFHFDNQLMEDHFNENYMESSKYPKAEFKGYLKNLNAIDISKDGRYNIQVSGQMMIHGVTQKLESEGILIVANGKIEIKGSFKINIKDFGINGLYIGDKIAKTATVDLDCKYE
ncbi:MAG: YceI family protein [Bacteroidota bacterium]|nr:YceI family protein [Bacteroidota bacterium]